MHRRWISGLLAVMLAAAGATAAVAQSSDSSSATPAIPDNPDSLFGAPASSSGGTNDTANAGAAGSDSAGTASAAPSTAGASSIAGSAGSGTSSGAAESPDQMFQGGMVQQVPSSQAKQSTNAVEAFLKSTGMEWGGQLYSDYTTTASWPTQYAEAGNLWAGESDFFVPNLEGDLYFDSRPYDYFRVFGKIKMVYPFQDTQTLNYLAPPSPGRSTIANITIPNISIFELYTDFSYNDLIYFRAGKQVVNWGVGYFFSPADVISLTPIDPQNPTLEREGPLALKVNVPFASVDNLYLYVIDNPAFAEDGLMRASDLALAPKVEFVVGDYEIGLGGYYQKNQRPKGMMTATGSLFGKISVFGEGVVSYGRDQNLVTGETTTFGIPSYTVSAQDTTTPFFSGTAGGSYVNGDWNFSLTAQYYYNGLGQSDPTLEKDAFQLFGVQQAQLFSGLTPQGTLLTANDLRYAGMHYLAAAATWSNIGNANVDLALFYEGNLTDGSGIVVPSVSWRPFAGYPQFALQLYSQIGYGDDNTQFVLAPPLGTGRMSVSLKVSIGEQPF